MTRDEIKAVVKQKIDEVSQFDSYQIDSVEFIEEFMDSAAKKILLTVPLHLIYPTSFTDQQQDPRSDGTGLISLPTDFLRLASFKMVEWDRAVVKAISREHPLYNLQKNNVTRGKPSKPICVIGYYPNPFASGSGTAAMGFITPGYYEVNYIITPTNAEITAIIGDATDYGPADNFLIKELPTGNSYWVYSDGTAWQYNQSVFIPAT